MQQNRQPTSNKQFCIFFIIVRFSKPDFLMIFQNLVRSVLNFHMLKYGYLISQYTFKGPKIGLPKARTT